MTKMEPRIYGYHCNEKSNIISFKDGDYSKAKDVTDIEWLGHGIYFWDNQSNAIYWKKKKKNDRKNKDKEFDIMQVMLSLERLLDLTDLDDIDFCLEVLKDLEKKGVKVRNPKYPGKTLNYLFHETQIFEEYHILKSCGIYKKHLKPQFFKPIKGSPHLTTRVKMMYCVKNEECIYKDTAIIL